jgi:serine/threonine protein kinase
MSLEAGAQIGVWRLQAWLGGGANGEVWLAYDPEGLPAAMKILPTDANERQRRALHTEARALSQFSDPCIPRLLANLIESEPPALAISFYEARPLSRMILEGETARLPMGDSLDLLTSLAETLHTVHAKGWLHRDIKPSNILAGTPPALIDFGIAAPLDADPLNPVGTPAYAPPLDARYRGTVRDVYAVALVAYEVLFGTHALFTSADVAALAGGLDPHRAFRELAGERIASGAWRRPDKLPADQVPDRLQGIDRPALTALIVSALKGEASDPVVWVGAMSAIVTAESNQLYLQRAERVINAPAVMPDITDLPAGSRGLPWWTWLIAAGGFFALWLLARGTLF